MDEDLRQRSISGLLEQLARRNLMIEQLRDELKTVSRERDQAAFRATESAELIANIESDLARARADAAKAREQLKRLTSSRGYRALLTYRARVRRAAPPGTRRNRLYRVLTGSVRKMLRSRD